MKLKTDHLDSISGTVAGFPDMKRIIFMKVVSYNSALMVTRVKYGLIISMLQNLMFLKMAHIGLKLI